MTISSKDIAWKSISLYGRNSMYYYVSNWKYLDILWFITYMTIFHKLWPLDVNLWPAWTLSGDLINLRQSCDIQTFVKCKTSLTSDLCYSMLCWSLTCDRTDHCSFYIGDLWPVLSGYGCRGGHVQSLWQLQDQVGPSSTPVCQTR